MVKINIPEETRAYRAWGITFQPAPRRPSREQALWLADLILDFERIVPTLEVSSGKFIGTNLPAEYITIDHEGRDNSMFYEPDKGNTRSGGFPRRHEHNFEEAQHIVTSMLASKQNPRNEASFREGTIHKVFFEWKEDSDYLYSLGPRFRNISHISADPIHSITYGTELDFTNGNVIRMKERETGQNTQAEPQNDHSNLPKLKISRPDGWFGFPVENDSLSKKFSSEYMQRNYLSFTLRDLAHLELKQLWASPFGKFNEAKNNSERWNYACFPSVIVEIKKVDGDVNEVDYLYCQIARATSACAAMLKLWAGVAYFDHEMPIVGITFDGYDARVFLTYPTQVYSTGFHCQCIWRGDLRYLKYALQFRRILDTTRFWMIYILRPWILGNFNKWRKAFLATETYVSGHTSSSGKQELVGQNKISLNPEPRSQAQETPCTTSDDFLGERTASGNSSALSNDQSRDERYLESKEICLEARNKPEDPKKTDSPDLGFGHTAIECESSDRDQANKVEANFAVLSLHDQEHLSPPSERRDEALGTNCSSPTKNSKASRETVNDTPKMENDLSFSTPQNLSTAEENTFQSSKGKETMVAKLGQDSCGALSELHMKSNHLEGCGPHLDLAISIANDEADGLHVSHKPLFSTLTKHDISNSKPVSDSKAWSSKPDRHSTQSTISMEPPPTSETDKTNVSGRQIACPVSRARLYSRLNDSHMPSVHNYQFYPEPNTSSLPDSRDVHIWKSSKDHRIKADEAPSSKDSSMDPQKRFIVDKSVAKSTHPSVLSAPTILPSRPKSAGSDSSRSHIGDSSSTLIFRDSEFKVWTQPPATQDNAASQLAKPKSTRSAELQPTVEDDPN